MPFELTCLSRAAKVFPIYSEEMFVVSSDVKNGEQNREVLGQKKMIQALDAQSYHVRWQIAKCTAAGLITGLGALLAAIPANIPSVAYAQVHMVV